jgi:hypothetical protein
MEEIKDSDGIIDPELIKIWITIGSITVYLILASIFVSLLSWFWIAIGSVYKFINKKCTSSKSSTNTLVKSEGKSDEKSDVTVVSET